MIHQLVYCSFSPDGARFLEHILEVSRRRNVRDGITGLLIYHANNICQILEGEESKVEALYEKIEADPRHDCVKLIYRGATSDRQFPEWSLALARSSHARLKDAPAVKTLEDIVAASCDGAQPRSVGEALVVAFLRNLTPVATP